MAMKTHFSRRQALQLFALAGASVTLPRCATPLLKNELKKAATGSETFSATGHDISPIDRSVPDRVPEGHFSGDNPEKYHEALWNKEKFLHQHGGIPTPSEKTEIVVVGGGMSGLFSTYLLRDKKPILLDKANRFGGNSRAESWRGIDYSIGAAYLSAQDDGTPIKNLFTELGIHNLTRKQAVDEYVAVGTRLTNSFWSGHTAPEAKKQFLKLHKYLLAVNQGKEFYPEYFDPEKVNKTRLRELDRVSFRKFIEKKISKKLHPQIIAFLDHYCLSALGAYSHEISASSGLYFLAAEFSPNDVLPGGNARAAEQVLKRIQESIPAENIRSSSLVVNVKVNEQNAWVTYITEAGKLHTIACNKVIMSCPKFVAARVIENLEPVRLSAIKELNYSSYVLANVIVNKKLDPKIYDVYLLQNADIEPPISINDPGAMRSTDLVLSSFTYPETDKTIVTLYKPLPYKDTRKTLLAKDAWSKLQKNVREEIPAILTLFGANLDDVAEIRLTRWGHPIPVPSVGLLSGGIINKLRKPFQNRVFFIEQDNYMLPAIETCANEAIYWCDQIKRS